MCDTTKFCVNLRTEDATIGPAEEYVEGSLMSDANVITPGAFCVIG